MPVCACDFVEPGRSGSASTRLRTTTLRREKRGTASEGGERETEMEAEVTATESVVERDRAGYVDGRTVGRGVRRARQDVF